MSESKRQFCHVCLESVSDYSTETLVSTRGSDALRTDGSILRAGEADRRRFHTCRSCSPDGQDVTRVAS